MYVTMSWYGVIGYVFGCDSMWSVKTRTVRGRTVAMYSTYRGHVLLSICSSIFFFCSGFSFRFGVDHGPLLLLYGGGGGDGDIPCNCGGGGGGESVASVVKYY